MKVIVVLIGSLLVLGFTIDMAIPHSGKDHGSSMPEKYLHINNKLWDDSEAIAAGEKIYREKCLVCHGENGDGKGPASVASNIKPADFTNKDMVATMGAGYWFWRVAEGGAFPPFNSIMPAFKNELTEEQIWQVISYQHTFSHSGLHEHKELDKTSQNKGEMKPSH